MARTKAGALRAAEAASPSSDGQSWGEEQGMRDRVEQLEGTVAALEEQLARERHWQQRYHDELEARGLLCGVCMEDVVKQQGLECCGNRLCGGCEKAVAASHRQCPFCRVAMALPAGDASATPPHEAGQQQQQQQGAPGSGVDAGGAAAAAGPPPHLQGPFAALAAAAAAQGGDATVLLAAAAEAAAAALRGPSAECAMCGASWLLSSLARAEALPDLFVCRSCWRNSPDLQGRPFPAGSAALPAPAAGQGHGAPPASGASADSGEGAAEPAAEAGPGSRRRGGQQLQVRPPPGTGQPPPAKRRKERGSGSSKPGGGSGQGGGSTAPPGKKRKRRQAPAGDGGGAKASKRPASSSGSGKHATAGTASAATGAQ